MYRTGLLIILIASGSVACQAAEPDMQAASGQQAPTQSASYEPKLVGPIGRGFNGLKNIIISPMEIPCTFLNETQQNDNVPEAMLFGLTTGIANFGVRALSGLAEFCTIIVPKKTAPLYDRKLGEPATLRDPW